MRLYRQNINAVPRNFDRLLENGYVLHYPAHRHLLLRQIDYVKYTSYNPKLKQVVNLPVVLRHFPVLGEILIMGLFGLIF
ncbi:hypothetical protein ACFLYF_00280 [Chloroflexota bacterium]